MGEFNGLGMGLGTLSRLSAAHTRSISAENQTGEPGLGGMATEGTRAIPTRELGRGWKVSPSIEIAGRETVTLADVEGSGAVQHIWLTVLPRHWRSLGWRIWWDDEERFGRGVPGHNRAVEGKPHHRLRRSANDL